MIAEASMLACGLTPDDIVRELRHLPSAPRILPRLKQLLTDGNSAMHEIVALVRLDPGIAARVLQVANSAYFSKGVRCTTVEEAVNRVGYDQIYELVSYAVASQVLVRPLDVYGIDADDLWKLSVSCALAAETLAEATQQDRNVAYTNGLLHSLGMVAIDEWSLRGGYNLSLSPGAYPLEAVERERALLGFTQADVGSALLAQWEFAAETTEPVRCQYAPRGTASHLRMACLLHAAKWVRSIVCAPTFGCRPNLPDPLTLVPLGLRPDTLHGIARTVQRRLAAVSSLLALETETAPLIDCSGFPGRSRAA